MSIRQSLYSLASYLRAVAALLGVALLATALIMALPAPAYASFKNTLGAQAGQVIGEFGDPVDVSSIPDGTYAIPARTDSSMCILYQTSEDSYNKTNKEWATLEVSGGVGYVTFYTSRMYNYLYLGTNEEAAAQTNEDGTDDSAYIAGDPDMSYSEPDKYMPTYVPHGYTLEVVTLNEPITFSSFSGANYDISNPRAAWYNHEVVFASTDEIMQAIADSQSGNDGDDAGNDENGSDDGDGSSSDDENNGAEPGSDDKNSGSGSGGGTGSNSGDGSGSGGGTGSDSGSSSSKSSGGSDAGAAANTAKAEQSPGSSALSRPTAGATLPGVAISFVGVDAPETEQAEPQNIVVAETDERRNPFLSLPFLAGLGFFLLLGVGIALRVLTFKRGFSSEAATPVDSMPAAS